MSSKNAGSGANPEPAFFIRVLAKVYIFIRAR
jgi:hypothetical protein